jgi:hypothetical protein
MTGVIEWEFSLSRQRKKIHGKLLRIYERIYETMVNGKFTKCTKFMNDIYLVNISNDLLSKKIFSIDI